MVSALVQSLSLFFQGKELQNGNKKKKIIIISNLNISKYNTKNWKKFSKDMDVFLVVCFFLKSYSALGITVQVFTGSWIISCKQTLVLK